MTLLPVRSVLYLLALPTLCGMLAPSSAPAQVPGQPSPGIYVCKDEQGRVISSDQPIRACARRPMRELNRDGSVRRVLPAPLTRQQEKEAARQALIDKEKERTLRAQQAHDRHLLLTYESTADLRARQKESIDLIDAEIDGAIRRILVLDEDLKKVRKSAREWQVQQAQQGKSPAAPLPYAMQQRISSLANAILAEDALIKERRSERERINRDYDGKAARLTELLADIASSPQQRDSDRH